MKNCSCGGSGCKLCASRGPAKIFLPIEPMGAVRTTQKQKFVDERYKRYHSYKEALSMLIDYRMQVKEAISGPIILRAMFYMPMPKSGKVSKIDAATGKRKQFKVEPGDPHIAKPDTDNLIKGLKDALKLTGVYCDDCQVYDVKGKKVYSDTPGIEFSLLTL